MSRDIREAIVLPCGHLLDRPDRVKHTELCAHCGAMWLLEHDRNGTWNATKVAG